ncbi:MAG: T9SS type A sorting domain-containing protein, partial [Bacteroidetes bacterium]|nr:T9SS type A sorting domain-containing protein [Bacteroidota bacterium]
MKKILTLFLFCSAAHSWGQAILGTIPFNGPISGGARVICEESGKADQVESLASGITLTYTIPLSCTSFSGIATTDTAFTAESFAGGSYAVQGFTNGGSYNLDFTLGGSSLGTYREFAIYFQARVSSKNTATSALKLAYSIDGGATFVNVGTTDFRESSQWQSFTFELPVGAWNPASGLIFRIIATGGAGASGTATLRIDNVQVQATQGGTVARTEEATQGTLRVYPNPARETLHINLSRVTGFGQLALRDVQGRTVRTATFAGQDTSFSLEGLAPGLYTLQALTTEGAYTQRVV